MYIYIVLRYSYIFSIDNDLYITVARRAKHNQVPGFDGKVKKPLDRLSSPSFYFHWSRGHVSLVPMIILCSRTLTCVLLTLHDMNYSTLCFNNDFIGFFARRFRFFHVLRYSWKFLYGLGLSKVEMGLNWSSKDVLRENHLVFNIKEFEKEFGKNFLNLTEVRFGDLISWEIGDEI